jgi:hypothetical protein
MQHPPRRLAWFAILLVSLCIVLFVVPWPGLTKAYACVFRAFGNALFTRYWFWSDGSVRFLDLRAEDLVRQVDAVTPVTLSPDFSPPPPQDVKDTLMVLLNRRVPGAFGLVRTSARSMGYWTTALFVALAVAWPMSWKRRGWALLWGMLLVHLFIALRLTLTLAHVGFAADKEYALFQLGPFAAKVLARTEEVLVDNPTVSFFIAGLIWLIVALPEVIQVLFPASRTKTPNSADPS